MTRPLTRTPVIAAALAALMTLTAMLAGATPAMADPVFIDEGHYDLVAEIDCDLETIELLVENHDDTTVTYPLEDVTFEVTDTTGNSVTPTSGDTTLLGSTPARVLTENELLAPEKLVIGLEVEDGETCDTIPAVTFAIDQGTSIVPTGGRAAAYINDSATQTQLDTAAGTGRNVGASVTGHDDRRWGFEITGDYTIALDATVNFGSGIVPADGVFEVDVS